MALLKSSQQGGMLLLLMGLRIVDRASTMQGLESGLVTMMVGMNAHWCLWVSDSSSRGLSSVELSGRYRRSVPGVSYRSILCQIWNLCISG